MTNAQNMSLTSRISVVLTCGFLTYTDRGMTTRKAERTVSQARMSGVPVSSDGSAETTGVSGMARARKKTLDRVSKRETLLP